MKLNIILAAALFTFISALSSSAQSTIFNVPSTDIVAQKKVYVEADMTAHLRAFDKGGFEAYGLRGVYGLRRNLELGANLLVSRSGSGTPIEIQPNFKWRAYQNERHNFAVSGGTVLFVPLNRRAGTRTQAMFYATASKGIKQIRNLRITSGAYSIVGAEKGYGSRKGAIVGIEQPLHRRANLITDWYSGKNRLGYSTAGVSIIVSSKQTLFTGYSFGNSGRGNNCLSIYYGITF